MRRRRASAHSLDGEVQSARVTQYEAQLTVEKFKQLLERREAVPVMFLDADAVYDSCVSGPLREAVDMLGNDAEWCTAINHGNPASVMLTPRDYSDPVLTGWAQRVPVRLFGPYSTVYVDLGKSRPLPRIEFKDGLLLRPDNPHYATIEAYLTARGEIATENEDAIKALKTMMSEFSTYGQCVRIWPEMFTFIAHKHKRTLVHDQKVKSPLPRHLDAELLTSLRDRLAKATIYGTQAMLLQRDKKPQWKVS